MAAYVHSYTHDLFISYAHIDNGQSGWVGDLHRLLEERIAQLLGSEISVWRDPALTGSDRIDDAIKDHVMQSAVMLAVVTPRYLNSRYCRDELRWFTTDSNADPVTHKSRLARLRKTPLLDDQREPSELAATLGWQFFEPTPGSVVEYSNLPSAPSYHLFRQRVFEAAAAIAKVLKLMRDRTDGPTNKVIYLAETTSSLRSWRDQLRAELEANGHEVVPRNPLIVDGRFDTTAAKQCLARASHAVHLLGPVYGLVPEEEQCSVPHLQYDLASQRGAHRIVWIQPGANPESEAAASDPKQAAFLDQVRNSSQALDGPRLDIVETRFTDLKIDLLEILTARPSILPQPTLSKSIYLLFHEDDLDNPELRAMRHYLAESGFPVEIPVFEAPPGKLREIEERKVTDNDATIIYFGRTKDDWVDEKRKVLLSALGRASQRMERARALYLCLPKTKLKQHHFAVFKQSGIVETVGLPSLLVLGDCDPFSGEKLEPLLSRLGNRTPAPLRRHAEAGT